MPLAHQFESFYAQLRLANPTQPRHLHLSSKIFLRVNQPLTTHSQVFRKTPLAPPKSPPTFAVPNRQTDYGALGKHPEKNLERPGTPAVASLSIHCNGLQAANGELHSAINLERLGTSAAGRMSIHCASSKAARKIFFQTACKAEKSHRTFAPRFNRRRTT